MSTDIDPRDWATAQRRAEILSTLPERPSGEQIRDAMAVLGVGRTTLFRWLKRFREGARTSALAPRRRGPHTGMRPLAPDVLAIVEKHFRDFYATRRSPTLTRFWPRSPPTVGAKDCRFRPFAGCVAGLIATTRLTAPTARRRREIRAGFSGDAGNAGGGRAAGDRADGPHRVDVTVVDPVTRLPIGRPTLTLAIDVNTRMAMGFHLSLDPPSLTAVALCLTHAVMDKTSGWPLAGLRPNGRRREYPTPFTSTTAPNSMPLAFERACAEHGIDLVYRPPGTPRFGGHIERLIGTMMGAVHLIPGSHFSNIRERGDLDPERQAVMTLRELETYFALEIVGAYQARDP